MVVLRKVLVRESGTLAVFAVVVFEVVFIWIAIGMLSFAPMWFALLFLAMPVLFILLALAKGTSVFTGNKKASALFENSEVSESGVTLPEELEYETGRVTLDGYWTSTGRSRSYNVRRSFEARERKTGTFVEFPDEPFRVQVLRDGTGRVEAPAVRILSGPYRDALLIFFTDEGEVTGSGSLTLSKGSDVATVTFRGEGKELRGNVQAELSKARKVRIEVGSGKVWKRIAEGQSFDFTFSPIPEEKTVVFANYKTVSPMSLVKALWRDTAVLGHGAFELKAVLDVPLARDVVEKAEFQVELKKEGNVEKRERSEFEEEWGFWD
ncbi:hypothetical protein E3E30_08550 [Thermococcus sp. 9N3]|nr:hypothetical protein [Thermococcus sp. 9N3]